MEVSGELIQKLLPLLRPHLQDEKERRGHLFSALGSKADALNLIWNQPTDTFISIMVQKLAAFGEVTPEQPALCELLKVISEYVGDDVKRDINELIQSINQIHYFCNNNKNYIICEVYQVFIDEKRRLSENRQPDHRKDYKFDPENATKPIAGVRACDAEEFCQWLNKQHPLSGQTYRLPSRVEAENYPATEWPIGYWCNTEGKNEIVGIRPDQLQAWQKKVYSVLESNLKQEKLSYNLKVGLMLALDIDYPRVSELARNINLKGIIEAILSHEIDLDSVVTQQIIPEIDLEIVLASNLDLNLNCVHQIARSHNINLNHDFQNIPNFNLKLLLNDLAPKIDAAFKEECERKLKRKIRANRNSSPSHYYWLLIYAILQLLYRIYKKASDDPFIPDIPGILNKRKNYEDLSRKYASLRDRAFNIYTIFVLIDERRKGNIPAWEGIWIVREKVHHESKSLLLTF